MSKMEPGLYDLLTKLLKESDHPMTCVELYEREDVRALANSANRVSDYLGGLWRKGQAARLPFTRTATDASRWAYAWRERPAQTAQYAAGADADARPYRIGTLLVDRPNILITEHANAITIDLPAFSITVKAR